MQTFEEKIPAHYIRILAEKAGSGRAAAGLIGCSTAQYNSMLKEGETRLLYENAARGCLDEIDKPKTLLVSVEADKLPAFKTVLDALSVSYKEI